VNSTTFRPQAYNKIIGKEDFIINDIVRKYKGSGSADAFIRAGPRSKLHFNPREVKAAIVTCGGLCPGLNNVIRELVHALHYLYAVDQIFGIK
jgi:6-phosphofructokinase 1